MAGRKFLQRRDRHTFEQRRNAILPDRRPECRPEGRPKLALVSRGLQLHVLENERIEIVGPMQLANRIEKLCHAWIMSAVHARLSECGDFFVSRKGPSAAVERAVGV